MAKTGKAYSKQSVKKTGRERKEKLVAELTEKLDATNGLVFTDYKGANHQQLETLKRELKKDNATIIIAKNSLMKISLGNSKDYKEAKDNEALVGPIATLFIKGDMVEPLKKLQKAAKEAGLPKVKFGVLEGQVLDEAGVTKIASLPNRETLLTQLAGMLNSPIQGFVTGLNSIPQKFVMTLDAVAKSKPADKSADATSASNADKSEDAAQDDKPAEQAPENETPEDEKPTTDKSADEAAAEASASTADEPATVPADEKKSTDEKTETKEEGGEK